MGIKYTSIKNPNDTRWNSQHDNLDSILKLRPALDELFDEDENDTWRNHRLSASEWKLAKGAHEVLKHVLLVTKCFETEATPTMNLVLEQLYTLTTNIELFIKEKNNCRYLD